MKGSNRTKTKLQSEPDRSLSTLNSHLSRRSPAKEEPSTAEILRILHKWGIHTLGQLAALDKEELRDRLGADAIRLWERANGTATRPLKLVQPPETFIESFEFDHEIETAEPLLFILRRFLEQLSLRLSSIYLVARELTLTIHFSKSEPDPPSPGCGVASWHFAKVVAAKETHIRVFKIPQPTMDVDLLFRMLQTHLEDFKSDHPIVAVGLSAEPIRPVSQQFGLFETALRNPHQLYETLARLTALVGNDRVGTPVIEETHRPDAFRMEAFCWSNAADPPSSDFGVASTAAATKNAGETMPVRLGPAATAKGEVRHRTALRRFRPPANAAIFISQDRHLQSDKVRGQIVDQVGPFLLSGNWWDEKAWARAEWDMQLENGELVRAHEAEGSWKLDGVYD